MIADDLLVKLHLLGYSLVSRVNKNTIVVVRGIDYHIIKSSPDNYIKISKPYKKIVAINDAEILGFIPKGGNLWGIITLDEIIIAEARYNNFRFLDKDLVEMRSGLLSFIINSSGKLIIPAIYRAVYRVFKVDTKLILVMSSETDAKAVYIYSDGLVNKVDISCVDMAQIILDVYLIYTTKENKQFALDINSHESYEIDSYREIESGKLRFKHRDKPFIAQNIYKSKQLQNQS